jgi:hypothetical protein
VALSLRRSRGPVGRWGGAGVGCRPAAQLADSYASMPLPDSLGSADHVDDRGNGRGIRVPTPAPTPHRMGQRDADRTYVTSDGEEWRVFEIDAADLPGARGDRCLVFTSNVAFRRVWHYPDDWRRLTPRQLIELSWRK